MTRSTVRQEFYSRKIWCDNSSSCGGGWGTNRNHKLILTQLQSDRVNNNSQFLDTIARMEATKMIVISAASL